MKRIIIALAMLFGLASPAIAAADGPTGILFGADVVYDGLNFSRHTHITQAPSVLYGADLYAGLQIFNGVSVEGGVTGAWNGSTSAAVGVQGLFAEATVRVPLEDWLDLDVVPGITWSVGHLSVPQVGDFHSYAWGYRLGAGPEVTIAPNLGWRTLVSYQQNGFTFTTGQVAVSTGLTWHI